MRFWLLVATTAALIVVTVPVVRPAQNVDQDLRITSAIYGSAAGSADVTPIVRTLAQPDLEEFYAAPHWLQVDSAVGQTKQLVVSYEYRGSAHILTIPEPGAVSYRILLEEADPGRRPTPTPPGPDNTLSVVTAYYGSGANFTLVTPRVRELLRPDSGTFVIDGPILGVRAGAANALLIVTYVYRGVRDTTIAWRGSRLSHVTITSYEAAAALSARSRVAPTWFATARPDPPRNPGTTGPGTGRAPRRELGISELLKAAAELRAIPLEERSPTENRALTLTDSALADAQRDIGYPYPPPTAPPIRAVDGPGEAHVSAAVRALSTALTQLSAATPGRRGGRGGLQTTVLRIREAIALLEGTGGDSSTTSAPGR
jgi:hypothetical protein